MMKKKSLVGYTPKWWNMKFERIWWVFKNTKFRSVDTTIIVNEPMETKSCKLKDFVKVRITIEEISPKRKSITRHK